MSPGSPGVAVAPVTASAIVAIVCLIMPGMARAPVTVNPIGLVQLLHHGGSGANPAPVGLPHTPGLLMSSSNRSAVFGVRSFGSSLCVPAIQ